ncbi:hypothetical protein [Clostridium frigidicarnis]|uniref:Zn-dependent PLC domain-containing protein n=1 Tax=Clostridium frigidicarnis TaxID=84698 RepID=A0A1I1AG32_9CLOT|nr:hypothetical protein [Clostridium frigidicarnis]SFB36985.1 hypothetical protein SAMN04488528_103613 [Clostridium frigidicarnis]
MKKFFIKVVCSLGIILLSYSPLISIAITDTYPEFNKSLIDDITSGKSEVFGKGKPFMFSFHSNEDSRWQSGGIDHTHQYLTSVAIKTLINDKGNKYENLIYPYAHKLLEGCDLPDIDETYPFYAHHFYNPYTNKNYLLGNITAKTKFIEHLNNAKDLYPTDKYTSFSELGRALHYLSDINEPHHSSSSPAFITNHVVYEKWADEHRTYYTINFGTMYDLCFSESFNKFLNVAADKSASNSYRNSLAAQELKIEPFGIYPLILNDSDSWCKSANRTMTYCEDMITTVLFRFFEEVI